MITKFYIKGTHCISCKKLLESVIADVKGVTNVDVDFKSGKTVIEHEDKFDIKLVKKEIAALGLYG